MGVPLLLSLSQEVSPIRTDNCTLLMLEMHVPYYGTSIWDLFYCYTFVKEDVAEMERHFGSPSITKLLTKQRQPESQRQEASSSAVAWTVILFILYISSSRPNFISFSFIFHEHRPTSVGQIMITRSLGDHLMKDYIIGEPYVQHESLTDKDTWLIVACDGVSPYFVTSSSSLESNLSPNFTRIS